MARSQLFSVACLALLASSALAAPACVFDAVIQSATLTGDKPKGCLTDQLVMKTVGISSKCFDSVTLYREAGAGCNGFGVGLLNGNNSDCIGGSVGNGTLSPAKGGGYTAKGEFLTGQQFTGAQSADNKTLTVSVKEFNCELSYALQAANSTAANATAGNATAAAVPGSTTTRGAETPSPAASPAAPTKSGVAAALPSAALLVLGAVMAFVL